MAFIEPMHHKKPNIIHLADMHWYLSNGRMLSAFSKTWVTLDWCKYQLQRFVLGFHYNVYLVFCQLKFNICVRWDVGFIVSMPRNKPNFTCLLTGLMQYALLQYLHVGRLYGTTTVAHVWWRRQDQLAQSRAHLNVGKLSFVGFGKTAMLIHQRRWNCTQLIYY